jgi:CrcB protein
MHTLLAYSTVFLGAGIGGALRHGVNLAGMRLLGSGLPYGTLTVNIIGSLAMGLLAGWFAHKSDPGQAWRLFFTTGVLGGFTTFSAFSLDVVLLYERQAIGPLVLYAVASVLVSVAALFLGLLAIRHFA